MAVHAHFVGAEFFDGPADDILKLVHERPAVGIAQR